MANRGSDSNKKMTNTQSRIADTGLRTQETAKTLPMQHYDDKSNETSYTLYFNLT